MSPRSTARWIVGFALAVSLGLNGLLLVRRAWSRTGPRPEELVAVPRAAERDRGPTPARRPGNQSVHVSVCQVRLAQLEGQLTQVRALSSESRRAEDIFRDSLPNPTATLLLQAAVQRMLGSENGPPVPYQVECRDVACQVVPLRAEDVTPTWINAVEHSDWFRNHVDGEVVGGPRRLLFKMASAELANLKTELRTFMRTFRQSRAVEACEGRFPHAPGTLAATVGLGGTGHTSVAGPDSPWVEMEGDLMSQPVAPCVAEALRTAVKATSFTAVPDHEASQSAVLIRPVPRGTPPPFSPP